MKQKLLTDIELDVHELKYLMGSFSKDPTETLAELLKRNIQQMEERLEQLVEEIDSVPVENLTAVLVEDRPVKKEEELKGESLIQSEHEVAVGKEEFVVKEVEPKIAVLGENLKVNAGLRPLISLNDSFRFTREIFGGDAELMNRVMEQISVMSSYKTALAFLASKVDLNEDNEAVVDLLELLKKFFNQSA